MLSSRKVAIALTIVMVLSMLVPAAMAAPEELHGITIDKVSPKYLGGQYTPWPGIIDGKDLDVTFTFTILERQVNDVWVKLELLDKNNFVHGWALEDYANEDLDAGKVTYTKTIENFVGPEGWYDLKVCAWEADLGEDYKWCTELEDAVLLDATRPDVWLDKPAWTPWGAPPPAGVWLTGEELMVGGAKDEWGLDDTTAAFDYCVISNLWTSEDGTRWNCGPNDNSWIQVAPGAVTATINEYGATEYSGVFDTRTVPDDEGAIRFCVSDLVGNENCDVHPVWIDNRVTIHLYPGWNLISTPLMLYNSDPAAVLHHLIALNKLEAVYAYAKGEGWTMWMPDALAPASLTSIDYGKGYWVKLIGEGDLEFKGTWRTVGNQTPPSQALTKGWNLIGYMHYGRPTAFFPTSEADDYLDGVGGVQSLGWYDAHRGVWVAVYDSQHMTLGAGYWLATTQAGTIRPH